MPKLPLAPTVPLTPTNAKSKHNEERCGCSALRRAVQTILKNELDATLSSSSNQFGAADDPCCFEALKRDVTTIIRNELREFYSEHKIQFKDTAQMLQPHHANDSSFSLLQEIISEIQDLRSLVSEEFRARHSIVPDIPPASATPTQLDHVEHVQANLAKGVSFVSDQLTAIKFSASTRTQDMSCRSSDGVKNTVDFGKLRSITTGRHSTRDIPGGVSCDRSIEPSTVPMFGRFDREFVKQNARDEALVFPTDQHPSSPLSKYRTTGFIPMVAQHPFFQHVTVAVIILNSAFVGIDTDWNKATTIMDADTAYVVGDVTFFTYFFVELLIRFMAYQRAIICIRDAWFLFDLAVLALYAFDPFIVSLIGAGWDVPTSVLRLLRLARLCRLTRLLRAFPELMIMIQAMLTALATVTYAILFLCLVTYVCSIATRSLVPTNSRIERKYFPNVFATMQRLVLHGTFMDDLTTFIRAVQDDSVPCAIIAWIYVVVSAMLVMNMLIGIICEVVSAVSAEENETRLINNVKEKFRSLLASFDHDGDGYLTWEEFGHLLEDNACQGLLKNFAVDLNALIDLAEYSFEQSSEDEFRISYRQFLELILDLRPSQVATVKDILVISKRSNAKFHHDLKAYLESLLNERHLDFR